MASTTEFPPRAAGAGAVCAAAVLSALTAGCGAGAEEGTAPPVPTPITWLRTWRGDEPFDNAGRRLAVDDWDGDGRDEVVIGVPSDFIYGFDQRSHGGIYRVDADTRSGELEAVAPGELNGDFNGDYIGDYLAAPGDLTGDGVPDVVFQGSDFGVLPGPLDGTFAWRDVDTTITGTEVGYENAVGVAGCGDLSGRGSADLCIGNNSPPFLADPSAAYIKARVFHSPVPPGKLLLGEADVQLVGRFEDVGGFSLGGGSDLTGDGLPDLLVGADERDDRRGGVFIVSDPPDGESEVVDHPLWAGEAPGNQAGLSLAVGGDLDGDGREDLFVGAHVYSRAYVVTDPGGGSLADAYLRLGSSDPGDWFGAAAAIGDVDGDGQSDLAVGMPRNIKISDPLLPGRVAVFLGPLPSGGLTPDNALFVVSMSTGHDAFGIELAAPDTDGDGDHELAVGAPYDDTEGGSAGAVYLLDPFPP